MQILSVTLKNFKTHRDRHFEFQPGTNAICGENGAGKTSILEAIAWTLFNYQGDYAKEDLIRNGTTSAQATVTFISNRDGRTYEVQRCTQRGYTLYDPQLNQRLPYTRIKDEVIPWLRQHLGVAPGTDLAQLFARTIGVPQGTFTVDFLQAPESRKTIFDAVLKVEDYKAAYKQMNGLRRYAEDQVNAAKQEIAQYEEALQAWGSLQEKQQTIQQEILAHEQELATLETALSDLAAQRATLQAKARRIQALEQQIQTLQTQIHSQEQINARLQASLAQAEKAAAICAAHQDDHDRHQAAEAELQSLAQQQRQRQTWQTQHRTVQKQLEQRQAEVTRLQVKLEALAGATTELQQLAPQVAQQAQREAEMAELQAQQAGFQALRLEQTTLQQQLTQNQNQQQQVQATLTRLQAYAEAVSTIPTLEHQCDRLQAQLSHLEAARQFEQELQHIIRTSQTASQHHQTEAALALETLATLQASLPLLSGEAIATIQTALESGVAVSQQVIGQLAAILQDLAGQTQASVLKRQLKAQRQTLEQRYQERGELAQVPTLEQQLAQLQAEQTRLQARLEATTTQLAAETTWQAALTHLTQQLAHLGNPRGQSQLLERSLKDQPKLQKSFENLQTTQQELHRQRTEIEAHLEAFADLDQAIAEQQTMRQQHQPGYTLYLQHHQLAQQQAQLSGELAAAAQTLQTLRTQWADLQAAYDQEKADYPPEEAAALEATYERLRSQADRLVGSLPQQRKLLAEVNQQIATLEDIAQKRDRAEQERLQRERIRRFVTFARNAYKEAGPRITEQYVTSISREADRLFRELLNRSNVALEWTRDYEIRVQEGPHERRFLNLSGGEQMCAALAVRLALLKVLADIDIAFFDEPTTNMDQPRRESLAEAIGRIRSFQQLFVISHDDTFEKVTENVVFVKRDEA